MDRSSTSRVRVLHVDDDPGFAEFVSEGGGQAAEPLAVERVPTPDAALDRFAEAEFACVVSEYDLPGMDGIELLARIRATHPDRPFVLFTAAGSEAVASEAISKGVTDYLPKGDGRERYATLANRVRAAVEGRRAEQRGGRDRNRGDARIENVDDPVVHIAFDDRKPVIQAVNAPFEAVFEYDADDVVGRSVTEVLVPSSAGDELRHDWIGRTVRDGNPVTTRVRRMTADGPHEFLLQVLPVDSATDPVECYAVYTDITEPAGHDEVPTVGAGTDGHDGLDIPTVFESVDIPTIVLDASGDVVVWNTAEAELVGVDREAVVGLEGTIGEQLYDSGRTTILAEKVLNNPQDAHEAYDTVELADTDYSMLVGDDGPVYEDRSTVDASGRSVWFIATPIYHEGDLVGAIEFTQDRTESERRNDEINRLVDSIGTTLGAYERGEFETRATLDLADPVVEDELIAVLDSVNELGEELQYMEELEQSREQRDNLEVLNQVMRHDIRNALQLVQTYTGMVQQDIEDDHHEYLERIAGAASRAVEITETARDVTEVMLQADVEQHPVPLRPALVGELSDVRAAHDDAVVEVDGSLPDVAVSADDMLSSVFRNVLTNAVEHNDKDRPEVSVEVTTGDGRVVVRIADNGPGIPDDRKEAVFEKGELGLDSDGTGLGLYLVETLVDRYGGTIRIEDHDPEGAVFHIELPVAEADPEGT